MNNQVIEISDGEWDEMEREFAERDGPTGAPYPLNEVEFLCERLLRRDETIRELHLENTVLMDAVYALDNRKLFKKY